MSSVKLIARSWVKNPVQDVLWCMSKLNNLHVQLEAKGDVVWAHCNPNELDAFTHLARKFCLVCGPFASA